MEWLTWFALSKCFKVRGLFSGAVSTSWIGTLSRSIDRPESLAAVKYLWTRLTKGTHAIIGADILVELRLFGAKFGNVLILQIVGTCQNVG